MFKINEWYRANFSGFNKLWLKQSEVQIDIFEKVLWLIYDFNKDENNSTDEITNFINKHHEVVGRHSSKSIMLPVVKFSFDNTTIVVRGNFYDFEISVISDHDLNLKCKELVNLDEPARFFQGFPDEYIVRNSYSENHKSFSLSVDYDGVSRFYAVIYELFSAVRNK